LPFWERPAPDEEKPGGKEEAGEPERDLAKEHAGLLVQQRSKLAAA
jgi:hypothetical protein